MVHMSEDEIISTFGLDAWNNAKYFDFEDDIEIEIANAEIPRKCKRISVYDTSNRQWLVFFFGKKSKKHRQLIEHNLFGYAN